MNSFLAIWGILILIGGGIWKHRPAVTLGVLLLIAGAFL